MNFLRSKIAQYKGNPQQEQPKKPTHSSSHSKQTKTIVFQSIKQWDKQRAQILRKHIKVIQQILGNIQIRVRNSQQYILSIQGILKSRLRQLQAYKWNSLNNSSFVLMNTHQPGYKQSFQLLKQLVIFEARKDDQVNKRYNRIMEIYKEFADWKERDSEKEISLTNGGTNSPHKDGKQSKNDQQDKQQKNPLDESSVVLLKSNVRYLIDCQLPDTIQQSSRYCQQINKSFYQPLPTNPATDLYILITKFLNATKKQVQKHRQIGRQLLTMNKDFIEREKKRSVKIKNTLSQWVRQDKNANPILLKQLEKQGNENLIEDYYNLQDLIESDQLQIKHTTIDNYLINISINPFQRAQQLILFKADAFYNKKIQTQVIITIDKFCHLRKPNHLDPDFSFVMNKEINFLQQEQFVFKVQKLQKKFLKAAQKEFQFCLEFNMQEDIQKLIDVLQDVQWVNLKCI